LILFAPAALGGAIIFLLFWDSGSANAFSIGGVARQFWDWLRNTRPISKAMALGGVFLLVTAAYIEYGITPTSAIWAGAALLGGAIVFRVFWDS
jgi:hypothetical protein